ncbi:YecA family protein [Paenibacillus arenosi]|uniref:SEC-C domain-containing protein n=1 Tax=Paenibacillus arenosi TaxID=2774142 RepID=A0ABR9B5A5_9BACL|nr:SEC-C metal-binding domain-containing protein [Paenibacillus arenosi]MBD8501064.1 SEC-C domain-containing protein [Paenibacillus arenosi]
MDIAAYHREINRDYVLEHVSNFELGHVLMQHTKKMLMQKAIIHGIAGRSKMKKPELISALVKVISDPNVLQETMLLLEKEEYDFYQDVMRAKTGILCEIMPFKLRFLIDRGIVNCIWHDDTQYEYFIPLETKEAVKKLDWHHLFKSREDQQEILKYIKSAVNLYGACKPELVVQLYNAHHMNQITEQKLCEVDSFCSQRLQSFYWHDDYFVSDYFEDATMHELDDLLARSKGKPYYMPEKEIFVQYAASDYYEITPQLLKLKRFIQKELRQNEENADYIIDDIQLVCSMELPMQQAIDEITSRGIDFKNYDQVQKVASLVIDVYNHTRIWSNCGYTPVELRALSNRDDVAASGGSKQHANVFKIGRNEPCVCGSGKKHKKCCGSSV